MLIRLTSSGLTRSELPLTDGAQVASGSCNPVPMGVIGAQNRAPTSKFISPRNLDMIKADETFTIQMKINNLVTGNFVNAQANYFSAPQNTNSDGIIIGESSEPSAPVGPEPRSSRAVFNRSRSLSRRHRADRRLGLCSSHRFAKFCLFQRIQCGRRQRCSERRSHGWPARWSIQGSALGLLNCGNCIHMLILPTATGCG